MAAVTRFEFRRLVRALDEDAFERFVADLWRARGWDVEREETLVVEHPTLGDRRTLAIRAIPWWRPGAPSPTTVLADTAADLVVVNRHVPGRADQVVGSGDLYEMVHYAVDPEARARLFRSHLDRSGSLTSRAIRRLPPGGSVRPTTVAVALSVLLAAVVGVSLPAWDDPDPAPGAASGSVPPEDAGVDRDTPEAYAATPDAYAATRWPGTTGGYPPGIDASGITDPAALASTHARQAGDRSYELTLTVREFDRGRRVGLYRERIAVRDRWTFASWIEAAGDLPGDHPAIAAVELYSDGEGLYLHTGPTGSADPRAALRASPGDVAGLEARVERYLASALSVNESRVVETTQIGETTLHRVAGTDRLPGGGTENVSASVTARGAVHDVRVERDVPGADRSIVVTLEYVYGPVAVDRPDWVGNDSVTVGRSFPISKR